MLEQVNDLFRLLAGQLVVRLDRFNAYVENCFEAKALD